MSEPEIKQVYASIEAEEKLSFKQKEWLKAFFSLGFVVGRQTKTCAMVDVHYSTFRGWKRINSTFQEWLEIIDELIIADAEQKLYQIAMERDDLDAIKLILTRLSNKWKDRVDITSGGEKITAIQIGLIE